jgi:protein-S-isoprenylcysteine O-methyltransferase Ste14
VTAWRQLRAIAPLPGVVTGLIPVVLLATTGANVGWGLGGAAAVLPVLLGLALLAAGFSLWLWTVRLFARIGEGTLAPWDPTRHLVVAGPYRHVRNPMIAAVVTFLAGEAALFGSLALLLWAAAFFAINHVGFLVYEEPGLEKRFGEEYRAYKRNVPRWRPRRTPWAGLALLALALSLPAGASGAVRIWVSPRGSDAGAGTKADPFATLARAQRQERRALRLHPNASVSVILRGGTYRLRQPLTLNASDSARRGHRVVYRAYEGERPVLSGAVRVPGSAWSLYDKQAGIWRAHVGKVRTRELYVNGSRATRAATSEYPAGFRPAWNGGGSGSGIEYLPTVQPEGLNPPSWGDPTTWTNVGAIEAVILTQWKTMSVPLESVVPASGSTPGLLRMAEPAWQNANAFRGPDGEPGIWSFWQVTRFENALQFLDEPGEWYLDEAHGWLYYMPYSWQHLRTADVELPVRQALVRGKGTAKKPIRNVEFRGLTFAYATWLGPSGDSGYVSDQGGFHLVGYGHEPNEIGHDPNDAGTPGDVSVEYGRNVRFAGDRFRHLGAVGLALGSGSHHDAVVGSTFADVGSSALQLSGIGAVDHAPPGPAQTSLGNTISGNLISHVAWEYPDAPGIFVGFSSGTKVVGNLVEDVPWSGIALGWGWGLLDPGGFPGLQHATRQQWGAWETPTPNRNSLVAHNTIREFLGLLWDGGAIYTTGAQGTSPEDGLRIEGNVAYGKRPDAGGNTFYTDGGSRYITLAGNVSYENPIGKTYLGPPPRAGDPLPYPKAPSEGNGAPYGSDIGGCVTYGDIAYLGNSWFEPPMKEEMDLNNLFYGLITGGKLLPYSPEGFFDICPHSEGGTSYPTGLAFSGNTIREPSP